MTSTLIGDLNLDLIYIKKDANIQFYLHLQAKKKKSKMHVSRHFASPIDIQYKGI